MSVHSRWCLCLPSCASDGEAETTAERTDGELAISSLVVKRCWVGARMWRLSLASFLSLIHAISTVGLVLSLLFLWTRVYSCIGSAHPGPSIARCSWRKLVTTGRSDGQAGQPTLLWSLCCWLLAVLPLLPLSLLLLVLLVDTNKRQLRGTSISLRYLSIH